jgi:hypothetical protein
MADTTNDRSRRMIEIIARDGEPQALLCPALICEACREQVAGPGNIIWFWRTDPEWQASPLFVAHKHCNRKVEALLEPVYSFEQGWRRAWREAKLFLDQLAHNFGNPFADDREGVYHDQVVVQPGGIIFANIHRDGRTVCLACGDKPKPGHYCTDCRRQG